MKGETQKLKVDQMKEKFMKGLTIKIEEQKIINE